MAKSKMAMCYPYGMGVSCICDNRGRIYKCFPSLESLSSGDESELMGEAIVSRNDDFGDDLGFDAFGNLDHERRDGLDERTEMILAATFLVLVILVFVSFVIYRCEKSYLRRRLTHFPLSPSASLSARQLLARANTSTSLAVNTVNAAVQTEPWVLTVTNAGNLVASRNGKYERRFSAHHSATLPHNTHLRNISPPTVLGSTVGLTLAPEPELELAETPSFWNERVHATRTRSFRDVHEVIAMSSQPNNRQNRDMHVEQLTRSPSVGDTLDAGAAGVTENTEDTEYAESDGFLGSRNGSSSNGSQGVHHLQQQQQQRF